MSNPHDPGAFTNCSEFTPRSSINDSEISLSQFPSPPQEPRRMNFTASSDIRSNDLESFRFPPASTTATVAYGLHTPQQSPIGISTLPSTWHPSSHSRPPPIGPEHLFREPAASFDSPTRVHESSSHHHKTSSSSLYSQSPVQDSRRLTLGSNDSVEEALLPLQTRRRSSTFSHPQAANTQIDIDLPTPGSHIQSPSNEFPFTGTFAAQEQDPQPYSIKSKGTSLAPKSRFKVDEPHTWKGSDTTGRGVSFNHSPHSPSFRRRHSQNNLYHEYVMENKRFVANAELTKAVSSLNLTGPAQEQLQARMKEDKIPSKKVKPEKLMQFKEMLRSKPLEDLEALANILGRKEVTKAKPPPVPLKSPLRTSMMSGSTPAKTYSPTYPIKKISGPIPSVYKLGERDVSSLSDSDTAPSDSGKDVFTSKQALAEDTQPSVAHDRSDSHSRQFPTRRTSRLFAPAPHNTNLTQDDLTKIAEAERKHATLIAQLQRRASDLNIRKDRVYHAIGGLRSAVAQSNNEKTHARTSMMPIEEEEDAREDQKQKLQECEERAQEIEMDEVLTECVISLLELRHVVDSTNTEESSGNWVCSKQAEDCQKNTSLERGEACQTIPEQANESDNNEWKDQPEEDAVDVDKQEADDGGHNERNGVNEIREASRKRFDAIKKAAAAARAEPGPFPHGDMPAHLIGHPALRAEASNAENVDDIRQANANTLASNRNNTSENHFSSASSDSLSIGDDPPWMYEGVYASIDRGQAFKPSKASVKPNPQASLSKFDPQTSLSKSNSQPDKKQAETGIRPSNRAIYQFLSNEEPTRSITPAPITHAKPSQPVPSLGSGSQSHTTVSVGRPSLRKVNSDTSSVNTGFRKSINFGTFDSQNSDSKNSSSLRSRGTAESGPVAPMLILRKGRPLPPEITSIRPGPRRSSSVTGTSSSNLFKDSSDQTPGSGNHMVTKVSAPHTDERERPKKFRLRSVLRGQRNKQGAKSVAGNPGMKREDGVIFKKDTDLSVEEQVALEDMEKSINEKDDDEALKQTIQNLKAQGFLR
ncbi:MAG: hypothetical protein M1820_002560 [Bogoriella megaspora]|nr:MAG: hypothetical protein M1820_002560 [Bogoriella megaspora]